jgi:hypothetical protein
MSGSALLAVSYRLMADAASSAEPTDWWRIIGLAAVTIATVAILAILFRPGALGRPEAPEPGEPATGPNRPPGLYPLPQRPLGDPAMDTTRAAERLRQIVSQPSTAETERRSPAAARDKQPERGPSATDSKEQTPAGAGQTRDEGTAMESGDHGPTRAGTGRTRLLSSLSTPPPATA